MNSFSLEEHFKTYVNRVLLLLVVSGLAAGCATNSGKSSMPKPGNGIAEYRKVAREAHQAVDVAVNALEGLALPPTQTSVRPGALKRFDRALHQLELTSVKTRARAEAIIARGEAYFEEWKEHLGALTNTAAARVESERYTRLFEHFERVQQRSGEVRETFRPFMTSLREFRARLDRSSGPPPGVPARSEVEAVAEGGRRVLQTLEAVATALDEAESELRATLSTKP